MRSGKPKIGELQQYYNNVIHPALLPLEQKRKQLLRGMLTAVVIFLGVGLLTLWAHIPSFSILLWVPIVVYGYYALSEVRHFKMAFKSQIITLILDFIVEGRAVDSTEQAVRRKIRGADYLLKYRFDAFIDQPTFEKSAIFNEAIHFFTGEDLVSGKVGNLQFEWCELDVKKLSLVRPGLVTVFRGVFFHANFHTDTLGVILMLPQAKKQYVMRTIKAMTRRGGYAVKIPNEAFNKEFAIYADHEIKDQELLSKEVYENILAYRKSTHRDIYVSFVHKDIHIAIEEPRNLLEPHLHKTNLSFRLVQDFYKDLNLVLVVLEDLDLHL